MNDRVAPAEAATLAALVRVWARAGRATVRDVTAEAGWGSDSTTHKHLSALAEGGLVAWEPETRGTLRPLVWPTNATR